MSLRLILGRAGSGKSFFCLNDIRRQLDRDKEHPLILLVPEQFTLEAEKNLVRISGMGGSIRAEVLNFRRMAFKVFNEVGGITVQHLSASGKSMLLYKIMDELRDELEVYAGAIRQKGFAGKLGTLISEFKRYRVTPEMLQDMAGKTEFSLLQKKLQELGQIYQAFDTQLHTRYMDADDDLLYMVDKLGQSRCMEGAELWLDEFSGFTPQEYAVIEMLLTKVRRITICLCADGVNGGAELFAPVRNTALRLIQIARKINIDIEAPVLLDGENSFRYRSSCVLQHLEKEYFKYPYVRFEEPVDCLHIYSAANPYDEVAQAAGEIIRLCREEGLRYKDVAVVTRNLEGYEAICNVIFRQYGIPCFIDRKRSITHHPLVQLVLSAIDLLQQYWPYESVFRYLKTGLTGIATEDVDMLENYVLAWGIRGKRWTDPEDWTLLPAWDTAETGEPDEEQKEQLRRINAIRRQMTAPFVVLREKTRGKRSVRELCTALFDFLCELGIPERIASLVEQFQQQGLLELAGQYGQIWNIFMDVLNQMVEVCSSEEMSFQQFGQMLAVGFGEHKLGLIPPAMDQVLVGSIERSKSHEIKALFILGVNDGVFPAAAAEEGVLSDKDRQLLRDAGMELAMDTREKAVQEQFLVYTALTTPSSQLWLSYPIADAEGKTLRPSSIISRLHKLFPGLKETSHLMEMRDEAAVLAQVCGAAPTFNRWIASVRRREDGTAEHTVWQEVYRWYMEKEEWRDKCDRVLQGLAYTNQELPVDGDRIRKLYGMPLHTSISRMESYAACPFAFFIKYGLKASERRIFALNAPDIGNFLHEAIERFSRRVEETGHKWRELNKEWCLQEISGIVDEMLRRMTGSVFTSSERYLYLTERLKRILCRAIMVIAEHIRRSGFEPVGYEVSFQEDGDYPPIVVMLPNGEQIRLTGRIDRVDAMQGEKGTCLRIIDYKSGSKDFKLCDVYYGLQIQLVAYMDAVWQQGGAAEDMSAALPAGMLYFRIDDPIIRSGGELEEEALERAILKQLRMKGLLLADVQVIKEMDRMMEGESCIIPARLNKGDVLGRSSAATLEQFDLLRKYVRRLLVRIGEEILQGDVSIRPYKRKKNTPCDFCAYASICKFDTRLPGNRYRRMNDIKDEDVWDTMQKEQENTLGD